MTQIGGNLCTLAVISCFEASVIGFTTRRLEVIGLHFVDFLVPLIWSSTGAQWRDSYDDRADPFLVCSSAVLFQVRLNHDICESSGLSATTV